MAEDEVPTGKNSISPEEFLDLEKGEGKKDKSKGMFGFFGSKKSSKDIQPGAIMPSSDVPGSMTALEMKLERALSRLDLAEDARKHSEERMSDIAEKIGELRSTLMDRDKSFNEAMVKFEKVSDVTEGLEPEKLKKELSKKDQQIEEVRAKMDSFSEKINIILNKQKETFDILDQIKGMKDLVSVAEELNKKVRLVEGMKNDIERTAAKFENRMFETNEILSGIKGTIAKVDSNDETIKDLLRTVDSLSLKVEQLANKDDLGKKQKEFDDKVAELKFDTESRFSKVLEAIKRVEADSVPGHKTGEASDKKLEQLHSEIARYGQESDELKKEIKGLKEIIAKKEIVGLKELIEVGGKDAKATIIEEIRNILKEDYERYNNRFADIELRMLELSKNIDSRIDRRIIQESKTAREAAINSARANGGKSILNMVDSGSAKGRFAGKSAAASQRQPPGESAFRPALVSNADLNSLVKDIYFYLESGKYEEARSGFIRLLASYERQESSNPFILAKITDLHKRIKQIS